MVLKALEKSKNITLTVLPCISKWDSDLWVRKIRASSTPMCGWYANCSGSRNAVRDVLRCLRTSLSNVFITCDVSATGL